MLSFRSLHVDTPSCQYIPMTHTSTPPQAWKQQLPCLVERFLPQRGLLPVLPLLQLIQVHRRTFQVLYTFRELYRYCTVPRYCTLSRYCTVLSSDTTITDWTTNSPDNALHSESTGIILFTLQSQYPYTAPNCIVQYCILVWCWPLHPPGTVSVLGREEGYTVKYTPWPEGVPKGKAQGTPEGEGVYLTVYPESSPNTDSISFKKSLG